MAVGLIGLGNIGYHFAVRLLDAGHDLVVFDLDKEAMERVVALGARWANDAKDVASQAEIVLLSLPMPQIARDVATGAGQVIDGAAVRIVLDLSTTGPAVTREIAAALADRGIGFVSAPVSGSTVAAQAGTLTVMAAGEKAAFDEVKPLMEAIGRNVFYIGADASAGQTMKLINNTLYTASMIATCEAFVYGVKAGLDFQTILDVLNVSSGRSFASMERIPGSVLDRSFPLRFTTNLLNKDVKMLVEDAERLGVPMTVNPVAREYLDFAVSQGLGEKDNVELIKLIEKAAGVTVGG
ncbi:MAG: NAD(P)-dependent oxidoreductase [Novosphingobium sp.]|nr:NAD(P)-dependent oxidoreductase [Novosphingobium sp.]